jgi:shikimate dehydrogenase
LRRGDLAGANVTVPWKQVALAGADRVDASASAVGAANVLARDPSAGVVAYNTDALALADELLLAQVEARGQATGDGAALVIGSGGAAYAAVAACQRAGFGPVYVTARRFTDALPRAAWPGAQQLMRMNARLLAWPGVGSDELDAVRETVSAVVQATSAGMTGADSGEALPLVLRLDAFPPLVTYDLVYNPTETPFLLAARQAGHATRGGLGMLVGQAARAVEIWLGVRPPAEPLLAAAKRALGL